jgi:pyruvate ferredoxin oxidoreductase gamma subunit/2-oxoisovalerate ferredoxin oxidoreductase gamma subunit
LKEIRFHGRGGQGVVIASEMLAYALVLEGKYASSLPMFGGERRGAPVNASLRFDDKPVRDTHQVYEPDCVVIIDPSQAKSAAALHGLKGDGILVANTTSQSLELSDRSLKVVALVDATGIALEEIKRAIGNTCMLGAIAKVTGWVKLESVLSSLKMYFKGEAWERNAKAARRGYDSVKIIRVGD